MPPEGWTWRDASGAGAWTIRLLILHAALSAVAAGIAVLRGLQPPSGSLVEVAVALLQMVVFFAAAIAPCAGSTSPKQTPFAFGAEDMMISPGWAMPGSSFPRQSGHALRRDARDLEGERPSRVTGRRRRRR
jgi:hypothetical protein